MDTKLLRKMANAAIAEQPVAPKITIRSPNPVDLNVTPFTGVYYGRQEGYHVYQLDAHQVLKVVERYEREFMVGGTK